MNLKKGYLNLVFLGISSLVLLSKLFAYQNLEYFSKPLIMIWIAVCYLLCRSDRDPGFPVLLAFFFSWLGDLFLLLPDRNGIMFYLGVGGFFLAQLSYIFIFIRFSKKGSRGLLARKPLLFLPFLLYGVGIYLLLLPAMEGIMKPIIALYALSLVGMSLAALNRRGRVGRKSFRLVFSGSLLFVFSDTMLAINTFVYDLPLSGLWIMSSYMAAQYLIMRGLLLGKA